MNVSFLAAINSRKAGGLYSTMTAFTQNLLAKGVKISLVSGCDKFSIVDSKEYKEVPLYNYDTVRFPGLKDIGFSINIQQVLNQLRPDIIHQQGIWMYYSYAALKYKQKYPNTIKIIEPHGMLDPWAVKHSAWKKKLVGYLFEYKNLHTADCIHALCQSEYKSIRKLGLKNPVAIIPNGINLPINPHFERNNKRKVLLYIGRIHPKKGLKELILGLSQLKKNSPELLKEWCVRIAGWDQNGHINELQELVKICELIGDVSFIGPVYGMDKEKELCKANAFILPSFSEGLPMSVLEAWAYQLPVIMTDFCNLPEGFDVNAAYRIVPDPNSICYGLIDFFKKDKKEIMQMGIYGYKLVSKRFTWEHITEQTIKLYDFLLGKNFKPDFVYED